MNLRRSGDISANQKDGQDVQEHRQYTDIPDPRVVSCQYAKCHERYEVAGCSVIRSPWMKRPVAHHLEKSCHELEPSPDTPGSEQTPQKLLSVLPNVPIEPHKDNHQDLPPIPDRTFAALILFDKVADGKFV